MNKSLLSAPPNHRLHELAGDTVTSKFGTNVDVQERGPPALLIVWVAEPWADDD
jgi:hypothetical protein